MSDNLIATLFILLCAGGIGFLSGVFYYLCSSVESKRVKLGTVLKGIVTTVMFMFIFAALLGLGLGVIKNGGGF